MQLKIICAVLLLLFLKSCDPALKLVIKVSNKPNVSVSIFANARILPDYDDSTAKIQIHLPTNESLNKLDTTFHYGIGTWEENEIDILVTNIDSLIITNSGSRVYLRDKAEMKKYLMKKREGFHKSVLTIGAN